ncbi:MAG: beta-N-acetylglucosaminidase domain-containing protein [Verrucomicrobiae bacterium]|nr:beta-N-acetylglucosaminidase domain-containing protein [Verrucomicrobiae bacterium]
MPAPFTDPTERAKRVALASDAGVGPTAPGESSSSPLLVSESWFARGTGQPSHDPLSRFILIVSGSARWECAQRRYVLEPITLCHVPAGLTLQQEVMPAEDLLALIVRYQPHLLARGLSNQLTALGLAPLELGHAKVNQARLIRSIFQEMLLEQESRQEGWEMMLHSRLLDIAVRTLRLAQRKGGVTVPQIEPGSESTDRVARYALQLKTRFSRQETMTQAARSVGLSRRQFTELFRRVTGQSWRQYLLGLRLKHAASLLTDTDRSVSAVAFESGFEDLSHFHHLFKLEYRCSPLAYREQHQVRLPAKLRSPGKADANRSTASGFRYRGMKGWSWTPDQYLEEIPILAGLGMNFLMNCYRSMNVSHPGEPWRNEWWRPMSRERQQEFRRIIRSCAEHHITFCFALHPQLASSRPLTLGSAKDLELFFQHYAWAQEKGVEWFAVCLDDTIWGSEGPAALGMSHSTLVNSIYHALFVKNERVQLLFCPACYWGDGSNPEHAAYLAAVAKELHPEIYVFWNGDAIVTPRVTRLAAESFKRTVQHRLFLWDNYPVNDGNSTMHLGPLSGREPELCQVVDGYLCNSMCSQNQINRLPLATAADYTSNPWTYKPARSIGQAILRLGRNATEQTVLKELVEAYPGFIVAGGGTGMNPVRAKFGNLLTGDGTRAAATKFATQMERLTARLGKAFPQQYLDAKHTLLADVAWMKEQLAQISTIPRAH